MRRKIINISKIIIFTVLLNIVSIVNVNAANAKISVSRSASTIVVGNNITFTVTISTDYPIGMWNYAAETSSNLVFVSSSSGYVSRQYNLAPDNSTKSITYKFTYRAKSSGNATFTFKLSNVHDKDENEMGINGTNSSSVQIITQAQLEASYSKNNYLSSLAVENYQISPSFNKDTLEYSLELPYNVTSINVIANKEDSKASVNGAGTKELSLGANKIEIKVTAQNGSTRTYIINATVKDLDPINVTVDNKEMSVVRKKELLTPPNTTFVEKTITIDEKDVPAFYNEKTRVLLVGLKDPEGNTKLYIYDASKNTYTIYREYQFKSVILNIVDDFSKIPEGYNKSIDTINDIQTNVYKLNPKSRFALFYATNIENGESNLYMYDSIEKTVQIYNDELINQLEKDNNDLKMIIIGLTGLLIITYFCILIALIKGKKKVTRKSKLIIADNGKDEQIKIATITETVEVEKEDSKEQANILDIQPNKRKKRRK